MSPGLRTLLRENSYLLLAGAGIELALLYLVSLGDLRVQVSRFWLGVLPAFLCYLFAAALAWRRPAGSLRLLLLLALAFRLTMWWSPPTLSEDIYRYVWDGRVQLAGINPFVLERCCCETRPEVFCLVDRNSAYGLLGT